MTLAHPHGQIWANQSVPNELSKETVSQEEYFKAHAREISELPSK